MDHIQFYKDGPSHLVYLYIYKNSKDVFVS